MTPLLGPAACRSALALAALVLGGSSPAWSQEGGQARLHVLEADLQSLFKAQAPGLTSAAEPRLAEACALTIAGPDPCLGQAMIAFQRGDLPRSKQMLTQAVQRFPRSETAWAKLAVTAAAAGDEALGTRALQRLKALSPSRAAALQDGLARAERNQGQKDADGAESVDIVVVLGHALAEDASPSAQLRSRIDLAADLARRHPTARLILSGGVPRAQRTEADVMVAALLAAGVDRRRLSLEDQSRDTVGNALFVARMLCTPEEAAPRIALVTSASHMARARTLLEVALAARGCAWPVAPIAAADPPTPPQEVERRREAERRGVYNDVARVLGVWSFPGLAR